ncbi:MAG: fasciclin domain-containing protein, partial [Candidatus Dadabacteria bacterium]
KLPIVTMYGQYLVTGVTNDNGQSSYIINRQGVVTAPDIRTGNGYIQEINKVLKPATKTVAQLISENANYSIFKEALVNTGYYDTLNTINTTDSTRRWLTVLAETNKALADSGITSYSALAAKYSTTGNPKDATDSLHIYVAYHILPGAKYLADIVTANSHTTLQPLEVLSSKLEGETVLINDIDFNGVHEPGAQLDRLNSDFSATNGVLHTSLNHFRPKVREAAPVYWDVADFPEIRKLPSYFRKQNYNFAYGSIKDITWDKPGNSLTYNYTTSTSFPVYWNDYLSFPMGTTSRDLWVEFRTPMIVKGKYKIWICYRAQKQSGSLGVPGGSNMPCQVYFDDVPTSRTMAFTEQRPNLSDGEMEALGWKRYTVATNQYLSGKYVGTVDVTTTDRHKIRIQALPASGTGQNPNSLDMIHFIPVNMPQYLPRFDRDGSMVYY